MSDNKKQLLSLQIDFSLILPILRSKTFGLEEEAQL
jgi:hypothetical protein